MRGRLFLSDSQLCEDNVFFEVSSLNFGEDYTLTYNSSGEILLEHIFDDQLIKSDIEIGLSFIDDEEEKQKFLFYYNHIKDIEENIISVELDFSLEKSLDFLKKHPSLLSKKIIIHNVDELEISDVQKIKNSLVDTDNLYFIIPGNKNLVTFKEYEKTVEEINNIVNTIKSLLLSPLEQVFFVYDLLKERLYKRTDDEISPEESRDLSKVLLGDCIVCAGYTRLFNTILNKLGIKGEECLLSPLKGDRGHSRSVLFIDDSKYNVKGIYYFDVTWDRKRNPDDNTYYYRYRYFGKTKEEIDEYTEDDDLIEERFSMYYENMIFDFEEKYRQNGFDNIPLSVIKSINHMSYLITGKFILPALFYDKKSPLYNKLNIDKVMDQLIDINEYFKRPIYANVILKVLINVRKAEYKLGRTNYPLSRDDLLKTVIASNWRFENNHAKLLKVLTGEDQFKNQNIFSHFEDFYQTNGLDEEIKLVKSL